MGQIKLRAGKYMIPCSMQDKGNRIELQFPYNQKLLAEVKAMQGAKWHGFDESNPRKAWSIPKTQRNMFQLNYLMGKNPYQSYDKDLLPVEVDRDLYEHQVEMVQHVMTRKNCILACDMGTGKTLVAIEAIEKIIPLGGAQPANQIDWVLQNYYDGFILRDWVTVDARDTVWYVGPVSGVKAVARELRKWKSKFIPSMFTYERLTKIMESWEDGQPAPLAVIFDESSKIKTPTAKRSKAALHLANAIREEHGDKGMVILMSGTPAPKEPTDWWHQCEVACPGFLKEGDLYKFKNTLAIVEQRESITGGMYPHLVSWKDSEDKCSICGKDRDDVIHKPMVAGELNPKFHQFQPSVNEVSRLYKRMEGLVLVKSIDECVDLPEERFEIIQIKPSVTLLKAAQLIQQTSTRAIQALTLMRELSDGFQYTKEEIGTKDCPECFGKGRTSIMIPVDDEGNEVEVDYTKPTENVKFVEKESLCPCCGGKGKIPEYRRSTEEISSPKDEIFIEELDAHSEVGRYIVWGGFTSTIDRLIKMANKEGWAVLAIDGRGYRGINYDGSEISSQELLDAMDYSHPERQELATKYPRVCVVAHPKAGGMALTLTASPTMLFYSNCFDGEARFQAIRRFRRVGMNKHWVPTVKDLILLPVDKLVLDNLQKKQKLQALTMNDLREYTADVTRRVGSDS